MIRRLAAVAASTCAALALTVTPAWAQEELPDSMAALGNSITRGFDSCGFYVDCPFRSWATGGSPKVDSHYLRLLHRNHDIIFDNHNDAVSGATIADLADQAREAAGEGADYVTVLMGANDACASTVAGMTSVAAFREHLAEGLAVLEEGLPDAEVFVASIPDIYQLWKVAKSEEEARGVWELADICQSMLDDPLSTDPADVQRRQTVRQRVIAYNEALAQACAAYAGNCRYGGAVFQYDFALRHISKWDYFHPSTAGQRVLAEITWEAGFYS